MLSAKDYQRQYGQGRTPAFVAELEKARNPSHTPRKPANPPRTPYTPPASALPLQNPANPATPGPTAAYIGLDPGVKTGVASFVRGETLQVHTLEFWEVIAFLASFHARHPGLLVVIEDPNLDRSMYARYDGAQGNVRTKIAQNVGANKRDAQLLLAWCARAGIATRAVRPPGKLTPAQFAARTGIARCSQHARDAAHLLFNYLPR